MIQKLSKRIFFLTIISLSIVVVGIIVLFGVLNYRNTINTASIMMDRVGYRDLRKNPNNETHVQRINIEGLYYVQIEDGTVKEISSENAQIEEYALKVSQGKRDEGIIGNYVYKIRRGKGTMADITFMENEEAISNAKKIVFISIIALIISVSIIYIIAKKVAEFMVKPVKETFEKQKQFISDASHELKTPLAVVEANADVLENEIGANKWLKYIQNEVQSMDKLVNELLLLAKIENVDILQEKTVFDLSKETEIIVSMFESMAYEKEVVLSTEIKENIMLNGSKEDIEHILSTLLDNAIKHTEKGNKVIASLNSEKNTIIIQVKNQGKEIPKEERENIFERFYRIDKSRNRKEKRYGLGLAIAKGIVEKYDGNISVLYKDGFTIFKVELPIK